jgi:hypothetical protein
MASTRGVFSDLQIFFKIFSFKEEKDILFIVIIDIIAQKF